MGAGVKPTRATATYSDGYVEISRGEEIAPGEWAWNVVLQTSVRGNGSSLYGRVLGARGLVALWKLIPEVIDVPVPTQLVDVRVRHVFETGGKRRKKLSPERAEVEAIKRGLRGGRK
jgi:hypothetical protein